MIKVSDLISTLDPLETKGRLDSFVESLHYDSRQIGPHDGFIALRGFTTDGHRFIPQLYQKGCRVFFVEEPLDLADAVVVRLKNTREGMARLAANLYGHAASQLQIVGITGTNGKTTTAFILYSILREAHWKPGLITTVEYRAGRTPVNATRTTPESLDLHRMFHEMRKSGLKSVVMEVSSHALALHRVLGIPFRVAVFTNLGIDHLDFHQTQEKYLAAKRTLFAGLSENANAIVNADDPSAKLMIKNCPANIFRYSMHPTNCEVFVENMFSFPGGARIAVHTPVGRLEVNASLPGKHNVYNLLAAITAAVSLGIQTEFIERGIAGMDNVPGRCEQFKLPSGAFVYVDYAHTPGALQNISEALLESAPRRLIIVFGCGGNRDRSKRPMMGKIAEDYGDVVILTNDNPRREEPQDIVNEILEGIYDRKKVRIILDRKEAILTALEMAAKNDIVLIAGKGHETYQEFADRRVHFDDREIVRQFIH